MKNRTYFKIISFILIQTFLVLDICWAASGQAIISNLDEATLSPSLTINSVDFQSILNKVDEDGFDLDFGGADLFTDEVAEVKGEDHLSPMSIRENSSPKATEQNVSGRGSLNNTNNDGGNLGIPPPDDTSANFRQNTYSEINSVAPNVNQDDDRNKPAEEMNGLEAMEKYGLAVEDIGFKQKVIDPLVRDNSSYFENVVWSKGGLTRADQGPFAVSANTPAQDAIDMAASALYIGLPLSKIIGKMMAILGFSIDDVKIKEDDYFKILQNIVSDIAAKESFSLKDVYIFATNLLGDFKKIGVDIFDAPSKDRKTLILNPYAVPVLRQEFMKNRENAVIYIKYMILLHEEGHVFKTGVLAYQLQWIAFKTKETTLNIFKKLILGDWPSELQKLGFLTVIAVSEYRSLVDVIKQSQWLYGYNPDKKEFKDALWKEAIANYYAFLKLVEKENGNDGLAIETLAIGTHYAIQFNPPSAEYLEVDLIDSRNAFLPFLNEDQSKRWMTKVLELQSKDGVMADEASKLLEKTNLGKMSIFGGGSNLFSLAVPAVFTTVVTANQYAMPSFGTGTEWLIAAGITATVAVSVWFWKATPFFKSVEKRTAQLVNNGIKTYDSRGLMRYYQSANISDKVKIVNIATQELSKKSDKVNFQLFESFFINALNEQSGSVLQDLQNSVKDLFEQRINLGINARQMQAILNEVTQETGLVLHTDKSVPMQSKLTNIINRLSRDKDLNVDSFITSIEKDYEIDFSINRMLVSDFVKRTTQLNRETGNSGKALKIIVSDYNDKYNLGINVDNVVSYAADTFKDFSLNELEKFGNLSRNKDFMNKFIKVLRNAQTKVLFSTILKNIIITRETQNAGLSKIIAKALKQVIPNDPADGNGMFPEIAILVGRLAIEGNLHKPDVFVKQAQSMAPIARVMDAEQMRALYNAIIIMLESGYKDSVNTKIELIAAEFDKAGINSKVGILTSGLAAAIMGSTNGDNATLLDTPLSEIGNKIRSSALDEQISRHYLFSKFNEAEKERVKQIIINIDSTLINNMALGLVFEDVNPLVAKAIESLDLKDINKQRAQLVLVNTLSKGVLLDDLQTFQAIEFNNAVDNKVSRLRYAAAVGLQNISDAGFGTANMVNQVNSYLNSTPNITLPVEMTLKTLLNNEDTAISTEDLTQAVRGSRDDPMPESSDLEKARKDLTVVTPDIVIYKQSFQNRFMVDIAI